MKQPKKKTQHPKIKLQLLSSGFFRKTKKAKKILKTIPSRFWGYKQVIFQKKTIFLCAFLLKKYMQYFLIKIFFYVVLNSFCVSFNLSQNLHILNTFRFIFWKTITDTCLNDIFIKVLNYLPFPQLRLNKNEKASK